VGQYARVRLGTLRVDIAMRVHTHVKQAILVMTTLRRVSMERAWLMNVVPTLSQDLSVMLGRCVRLRTSVMGSCVQQMLLAQLQMALRPGALTQFARLVPQILLIPTHV